MMRWRHYRIHVVDSYPSLRHIFLEYIENPEHMRVKHGKKENKRETLEM